MKQSKIECLSKEFRSTDPLREKLNRIFPVTFNEKTYSCATNANILILIPCENWIPEKRDTDVNVLSVFPELDANLNMKINKLEQIFNSIPERAIKHEKKVCSLCDNDGYFSIGGEDYNCKSCSHESDYTTLEHVKSNEKLLKFGAKYFNPSIFQSLFQIIQFMDVSEFIIKTNLNDARGAMVIELPKSGILLLIMPYVRNDEDYYEVSIKD